MGLGLGLGLKREGGRLESIVSSSPKLFCTGVPLISSRCVACRRERRRKRDEPAVLSACASSKTTTPQLCPQRKLRSATWLGLGLE